MTSRRIGGGPVVTTVESGGQGTVANEPTAPALLEDLIAHITEEQAIALAIVRAIRQGSVHIR
ncbi:MAG TPA: hypothetical protein VNE17_10295 [Nitrolancea sp.]|nr:hypothetical protein [Nitrolancea sp.]